MIEANDMWKKKSLCASRRVVNNRILCGVMYGKALVLRSVSSESQIASG